MSIADNRSVQHIKTALKPWIERVAFIAAVLLGLALVGEFWTHMTLIVG